MIGCSINNEAVFKVEVLPTILTIRITILIVVTHLKATCVGAIPVVKEVTNTPELL